LAETYSQLLPDTQLYQILSAEYDSADQGFVIYSYYDGSFENLGVSFLPETAPSLDLGIIETNFDPDQGLSTAVSSTEVACVYIDTNGDLHLQTSNFN
jgi:hypothetical protein